MIFAVTISFVSRRSELLVMVAPFDAAGGIVGPSVVSALTAIGLPGAGAVLTHQAAGRYWTRAWSVTTPSRGMPGMTSARASMTEVRPTLRLFALHGDPRRRFQPGRRNVADVRDERGGE